MRRGDLFRVRKPSAQDPKRSRVFALVSRQGLIETGFSTVICAPVYSAYHGLATQALVGPEEGLKHPSSIHCDELMSLPKVALADFVGSLSSNKQRELEHALARALALPWP